MVATAVGRPMSDEYGPFYAEYISNVVEVDPVAVMQSQCDATRELLGQVTEDRSLFRYGSNKWSIREVVGHLADAERVFSYRAMRIAREDETPIEGFDEDAYVRGARFDRRPLAELLEEWVSVRRSTIALFRGFDPAAWQRRGTANTVRFSVRAIAFIIPGHERHHARVLKERYGVGGT
jgi:hypothetical protein